MINTITSAISKALSENFEGYEIYKEGVEQGVTENSFFISHIQTVISDRTTRQTVFKHLFSVTYYPPLEDEYKAINEVTIKIVPILKLLKVGERYMAGYSIECAKSDHLLSVTAEYHSVNSEDEEGETIDSASLEIQSKEE